MDCSSYTRFKRVLHASKNQGLDLPEYIARCEDACEVIFGTGNPVGWLANRHPVRSRKNTDESVKDISGLGAMIVLCI